MAAVFREEAGRLTAWLVAGRGSAPARRDVAEDAAWLAELLTRLFPAELVLLGDQDRQRWNQPGMCEASALIERAASLHRPAPYQLQAAIAACRAEAPAWAETDWPQILILYDMDGYHLFYAILADLLNEIGQREQAQQAEQRALALTHNPAEQSLLRRRMAG